MNHSEAKQLQAAEKYLLGELSPIQRDEYEEHYFDCAECALDVKAMAAFSDNAREVLRQETASVSLRRRAPLEGGWFSWLRPAMAVPAFAVLLVVLGYQSIVTIPHLKSLATDAAAPQLLPAFSLLSANSRGGVSPTFELQHSHSFGLYVDIPASSSYANYQLRLEDAASKSRFLLPVTSSEAQATILVRVPGDLPAGQYTLVVSTGQSADGGASVEVARYSFIIVFAK